MAATTTATVARSSGGILSGRKISNTRVATRVCFNIMPAPDIERHIDKDIRVLHERAQVDADPLSVPEAQEIGGGNEAHDAV